MPNFCFETELLKRTFLETTRVPLASLHTFEALVQKLSGFERPYSNPETPLEKTIQLLREALILNEEHVGHCFSVLVDSPKNLKLKEALTQYLHSEKSNDWTNAVWQAIGELKEKKTKDPFPGSWIFVSDTHSSFLFQELAKAFTHAPQVEEVRIQPLGRCVDLHSNSKGTILCGTETSPLIELGEALIKSKGEGPHFVPFFGEEAELHFLKLYLLSKGLRVDGRHSPSSPDLFTKLRNFSSFPLLKRLLILRRVKEITSGLRSPLSDTQLLDRLLKEEHFTIEEGKALEALSLSTEPKAEPFDVKFLPWVSVPFARYAYAGEGLLQFEAEGVELTSLELENLYQAGFPLPRLNQVREDRLKVLNDLKELGACVFTCLRPDQLGEGQELPLVSLTSSSPSFLKKWEPLSFPPQPFSATQLETYAVCPSKYLFSNRFRLRKEIFGLDTLALLHGQITHLALERFFAKPDNENFEGALKHQFDIAIRETAPHLDPDHYAYRYLALQFSKVVPTVLELESQLTAIFGRRTPKYFEKEFSIEQKGSTFRGKIDRIDELEDGSLLVLDYKTGNIDFTPDHIKKGSHFQALLYLIGTQSLFAQPVAGMLFYDLKNKEVRRGVLVEERVSKEAKRAVTRGHTLTLEKYTALVETGLERAEALCAQIQKGEYGPSPSSESCGYCEFTTFCRSAHGIH